MRGAFVATLASLAAHDARIVLLTGDLGFRAVEPFADRFPDRFFNVGVAEQNMVAVATGLADAGFLPFTYSIAPFAALRPYEFIRNGPVLHRLPVRIVGTGGGFEYSVAGPTHHGLEDLGAMRLQRGLTVLAPADAAQASTILRATWDLPGPIYYRIGKDDETRVPGLEGAFTLGRSQQVSDGDDLLVVSMGAAAAQAAAAVARLAQHDVHATHLVVASLRPAPVRDLASALARFSHVMTVEAHAIDGGIGTLVAEVMAEHGLPCRLHRCGIDGDRPHTGTQRYLDRQSGIDGDSLAARALSVLERA